MPNPFPGMNPYLESATLFPSLHHYLVMATIDQLQPELDRRGYFASPGERVWLGQAASTIYPDVTLLRDGNSLTEPQRGTTVVADPPVLVPCAVAEIHEPYLEIFEASTQSVVTGIEFVSPSNKRQREGREQYRRKQRGCSRTGIHLVEIDLLRRGKMIAQLLEELVRAKGRSDYLINVVRCPRLDYEFYPIRLIQRLPRIRVPLKRGDEDIILDVQATVDSSYDHGRFARRIDYSLPPVPALADDDACWADELLKSQGIR